MIKSKRIGKKNLHTSPTSSSPRTQQLVDNDNCGSGGVKNCVAPSIDIPGQSLLSDIIRLHTETEIGLTVDVEHIPSHENIWILPKLNISKADTFTMFKLGLVPSSNFLPKR